MRKEILQRLREAGSDDLASLVERHLEELDPSAVRHILANPHAGGTTLDLVLSRRDLQTSQQVRRGLAAHPRTPEAEALRLIPGLFWHDLAEIGRDTRVRPAVRWAAHRRLILKLPSMAVGERIALARRAGHGLLERLCRDPELRVFAAVLENPRITVGLLLPVAQDRNTPADVLALLATDPRWATRQELRSALCRNPAASPQLVLPLLAHLPRAELVELATDRALDPEVRRRAELLSGGLAVPWDSGV